MKYDDARLRQILAAEYVLGTLRGAARRRFERLLPSRAELRAEVRFWETRFAPLLADTAPRPPRAIVWAEIERRIAADAARVTPLAGGAGNGGGARRGPPLWFWQGWAVAASAAVVVLSLQLYRYRGAAPAGPPPAVVAGKPPLVSMLPVQNGAAVWMVSLYPQKGEISVIARGDFGVDAQRESLELWLIGDDGKPRSLGLLPLTGRGRMPMPAGLQMPERPMLAVSREPYGGSPSGQPSGPVVSSAPVVAL